MPRKTYTEQVNRNFLRTWLDAFGTGTKTNANGEKVASPIAAAYSERTPAEGLSDASSLTRRWE